ncbi:AfsR/SARP family transcriptional regulator [Phytomonospora endophytica]|uniref:DNA-binding SARP family transcriptional activator n=1 Tax=Phytomonospora endophytica TaxID=714109 RepID=A0A841FLB2_9ACTN|nr:AfsR/SARP family transcriptional regulator [Phytomonospora endophytica]MBB6033977.1 DNA-binding SARP family transcriptional activator [Phytomonospora endophytica]GIG64502.1 SARP family transcriptional regulator [Phytomonospora endophytica]
MLEVVLLGPVEARVDGVGVPLAPLERNLLALLALSPGTVLSTERIIDSLWGERPPAQPRSRVQGLVSTLRRKLGDTLITRHPGYLLAVPPDGSDLSRCEDLARQARSATVPVSAAELLNRTLALWRGDPLDGVTAPGIDADRARLTELRVGLLEERFEVELGLGKHAALVGELIAAVAAQPLRERLAGQLMLALYRCNRQADALRAYQALRERLAEELGGDPCADLRELHAMILRGGEAAVHPPVPEPPSREPREEEPRPAQMPAGVGHFTGREGDLAWLSASLPGPSDEARVLVVTGAGGLGKTALVVSWAHSVADRFPDGQIFVELHGAGLGAALSAGSALGSVLLALGVTADQLPVSAEERAALYRTMIHRRRLLIVADDAGSVAQLLPLVPPTAGSLVVATSRSSLSALSAHHAVRSRTLEPLDPDAAHALLRAIVGPERLRGEGASEVVSLCGGWPLSIRLAGATLAARPRQSLSSFAEELREHADALSVADDSRTVRAALAETHAGLDPAAGRLFAQLGLLPGTSVCLSLAAATAGTSVLRARRLLDELISANLVFETGPDRYALHDMIRRFARRCGAALSDRAVVEERVVRWYVAVFDTLARRLEPDRDWPPAPGQPEWSPFEPDGSGTERFRDAESPNLLAVVRWTAGRPDRSLTWRLVALAHASGARVPVEACEIGLAAALELGDRRAAGEAHARLGLVLLRDPVSFDAADGHLTLAVELLDAGDGRLSSATSFALGASRAVQGRHGEAREAMESALSHLDPGREPLSYAVVLLGYAEVLVGSGAVDRGHERFAQAVILCQAAVGWQEGRFGRFDRGRVCLDRRLADEYLDHLGRSLSAPRVTPQDRGLARTLIDLGLALRARDVVPAVAGVAHAEEVYMALPALNVAESYSAEPYAAEPYRI